MTLERILSCPPVSKYRRWSVLTTSIGSQVQDKDSIAEISTGDLAKLLKIDPHANCDSLRERFEHGNRCFIYEVNSEPVWYGWVFVNSTEHGIHLNCVTNMHVDVVLAPGQVYLWDVFTRPTHRGRGVHGAATTALFAIMQDAHVRECVTVVNVNNSSSLRAFQKSGFVERAVLTHFRLFGQDVVLDGFQA